MYNVILKRRPLSYNSCSGNKKVSYTEDLQTSFVTNNSGHSILVEDIYAIGYHFFNTNLRLDADNLSKPVWDCLKNIVFDDEERIKLRTAGNINLKEVDYGVVDMSGLNGDMVVDLLNAFENESHVLYIECGLFNRSMV